MNFTDKYVSPKDKQIIQFHDGKMIRQRVCLNNSVAIIMNDLRNAGIDMTTVIATNRHVKGYHLIGYLDFNRPLLGDKVTGIIGA